MLEFFLLRLLEKGVNKSLNLDQPATPPIEKGGNRVWNLNLLSTPLVVIRVNKV